VVGDHLLRLLLGADEQDRAAAAAEALDEVVGLLEAGQGPLEVDEVDPGTLPEQVGLHLRVPPARLVAEMHARLEELPPGDDRHEAAPFGSSAARIDSSPAPKGPRRRSPDV
jgi:hypothetical protein